MGKRYFVNILSDSNNDVVNTSSDFWKKQIYSLIKYISSNVSSSLSNDLYTGTTGIAYMFYHLAISDELKNDSMALLSKALTVLNLDKNTNYDQPSLCQFICGDAGVCAVKAAISHQMGDLKSAEMYLEHFKNGLAICKPINFFKPGGDELFVGRTGYLYGILWLKKVFGRKIIPDKDIIELCSTIVESGRKYSKRKKSIFPLMYSYYNTEYLGNFFFFYLYFKFNKKYIFVYLFHNFPFFVGAAHGLCTILQVLISFPQFIEREQQAMQDLKKCIDILISLQTASGNFPCAMDELGSNQRLERDELVHWCHGAPGNQLY